MRYLIVIVFLLVGIFSCSSHSTEEEKLVDYVKLSEQFLLSTRYNEDVSKYLSALKVASSEDLSNSLKNDQLKKTFWINCYNALIQFYAKKNSDNYSSQDTFFNSKQIEISGEELSFNDIENGFLRDKVKQLPHSLTNLIVDTLDYRIHFALNCGAKSCPPIATYKASDLNYQLDIAEESYIVSDFKFDKEKNTLEVSELFRWYSDDFGGESGIIQLAKKHKQIPQFALPSISYKPFNWDRYVNYLKSSE